MALVVFLKGLNVGGHRTFRPTRLAEQLQYLDAVNIGAAGTFVIVVLLGVVGYLGGSRVRANLVTDRTNDSVL